MFSQSPDLKVQQLAFALVEPSAEAAHLIRGHDESREAEDRTVVVARMRARDVRADVAELVEVGDVDQTASRKRESPHLGAGLGKRTGLASCVSALTPSIFSRKVDALYLGLEVERPRRNGPIRLTEGPL